nr:MAG TPA: Single strand binding protein [Caudoviricetes sp.]
MQRLNKVRLSGRAGEIVFSHEHYGRYYYKFMLTVIRRSGAVDMFPIVIEDSVVRDNDYNGKEVLVTGAIRSMDTSKNPNKHHNVNYIAADKVEVLEEQVPEGDINEVEFIARSCTIEPYAKLTPVTHRKVLNLFVAIPRDFSERADFIRCTLWGKGADLAVEVKRNDYIKVTGRLMSRDVYVNVEETESVYEISVKEMEILEDEKQ